MSDAEATFFDIGDQIDGAEKSQMFGKKCYKIGGKAFICFFEDCMVFKLLGDQHVVALALSGSKLFDPSGKNRPMKEWVQVSYDHSDKWLPFAVSSCEYVANNR